MKHLLIKSTGKESYEPLFSSKPAPCAQYMQHLLLHRAAPSKQTDTPAAMARMLGRSAEIKATCCHWDNICVLPANASLPHVAAEEGRCMARSCTDPSQAWKGFCSSHLGGEGKSNGVTFVLLSPLPGTGPADAVLLQRGREKTVLCFHWG